MSSVEWEKLFADDLARLREIHLYRERRVFESVDATHIEWDGRRYVNFASNDYLGLTHHPRLIEAGRQALAHFGAGSGAAALISGYGSAHASAELALAQWKGTEAAVLLPSGYQANHAAVQTLAYLGNEHSGGVRFLVDKLAHASLIDAVRGSGAPFRIFPHNHLQKLERLLTEAEANELQVVVTESIFSMDGDAAPLAELASLKRRFGFLTVLDEAHATGIYGATGAGLASELGLPESIDVSIVTLSKAMGSIGGAVCGGRHLCECLINHGRAFIFSTSVPPHVAAIAEAAVGVARDSNHSRDRLRTTARHVRDTLARASHAVGAGDSPIIPIILGSEQSALIAARFLLDQGMFVAAVRPPTVPRGQSRLRITLSSEHTDQQIDELLNTLTSRAITDLTTSSPR
jgi:8-amino-7-oxononanoate synthase